MIGGRDIGSLNEEQPTDQMSLVSIVAGGVCKMR